MFSHSSFPLFTNITKYSIRLKGLVFLALLLLLFFQSLDRSLGVGVVFPSKKKLSSCPLPSFTDWVRFHFLDFCFGFAALEFEASGFLWFDRIDFVVFVYYKVGVKC